jgi:hypothetical protein
MAAVARTEAQPSAQERAGVMAAQVAIARTGNDLWPADSAWLAFVELVAAYGHRSPACRAFIAEISRWAAERTR